MDNLLLQVKLSYTKSHSERSSFVHAVLDGKEEGAK